MKNPVVFCKSRRGAYAVYYPPSARSAVFRDSRAAFHAADIGFIASGKARIIPRSHVEQGKYLIESFAEHRLVSCYDFTIILAQSRRKINELTEKNVNDNLLSTLEAILIIVV